MISRREDEWSLGVEGGASVFVRSWPAKSSQLGTILGCHGYSEHSGSYRHFAEFFNSKSLNVVMMDLPGHGLSTGERGNIESFDLYVKSFFSVFDEMKQRRLPEPYYFFGHSLGGLVVIRSLQMRAWGPSLRRVFLSSPLLNLSEKCFFGLGRVFQFQWGRRAVLALTQVLPNLRLSNEAALAEQKLTHDSEAARRRRADQLICPEVTTHWTREFLKARERAFEDAVLIRQPLAIFQAGDDHVTSADSAKDFLRRISVKEKLFRIYPDLYHEILNENQKLEVMEEMAFWLFQDEHSLGREMGSI
ncbi:MAG: alpha/beta hydrolase [Bradymonadales bacterium]|nr:MAG: alpha/beta hydrolase [Bradymonadales bacterium]